MLWILACGVFSILNTEMGIIGILPAVAGYYNVDIVQAGLLVSLFAAGVAVAGPTLPLLCSRFRRKHIMMVVLGIFTLCNAVAVMAPSFEVLLAARVIPAFFHPVYCATAFSLAASMVKAEEAPRAVARINMGVAAGMVIGVPVSSYLADNFGFYEAMAFFAAVTGIMLLLTAFFIPDRFPGESKRYGEQLLVLRRYRLWAALVLVVLFNGSIFGVYNYLAEYLQQVMDISGDPAALLLFIYGVMNVAGSYCGGQLLVKNASAAVGAFPVMVLLLYLCLSAAPGQGTMVAVAVITAWGLLGGINANINQFLVARAAGDAPDFANGLFLTAANIGCVAGTFMSGFIIRGFGISSLVFTGIGMAAAAGILLAVCRISTDKFRLFVKL